MRAITLHQPWAAAIAHLDKRLENRSWPPPKTIAGKRIAIHAGKTLDKPALEGLRADGYALAPDHLPHGVIVCTALVTGHIGPEEAEGLGHAAYWWAGPIAWLLRDVRTLAQPVPCRGAQGVWLVPEAIAEAVREREVTR